MEFSHISVLLSESVECLMIKSGGTYVDGTLGGGGHSKEICARLQEGRLVAIDQDAEAINAAKNVLSGYENITTFVHSNFSDISEQLRNLNIKNIDGCLLDLGVSSFQLDEARRGFSYMSDAPLDMRMDASQKLTAYDIINKYTESELSNIIFRYGEERWAKRIAKFIVEERKRSPVETTLELVSVIKAAMPKAVQFEGGHPAKRTFQAIRIEVNNELEILEGAVKDIVELLNPKGRLAIITFHSLEDRIIKNAFRNLENPCTCPHDFPVCMCKKKSAGTVITKKPIIPSVEEIQNNSRSKSAKLRVFEKIFE